MDKGKHLRFSSDLHMSAYTHTHTQPVAVDFTVKTEFHKLKVLAFDFFQFSYEMSLGTTVLCTHPLGESTWHLALSPTRKGTCLVWVEISFRFIFVIGAFCYMFLKGMY